MNDAFKDHEPDGARASRRRKKFKHQPEAPPDLVKIVTYLGIGLTILATLVLINVTS